LETAVLGLLVLWEKVEGCEVHDNEVAASIFVEAGDLVVYAVDVVCDGFTGDLAVGQERVVTKIVRPDPDCIDGAVGLAGEEFGSAGVAGFGVGDESWEFVAINIRERRVDRREVSW
jgi:hypothetical protein